MNKYNENFESAQWKESQCNHRELRVLIYLRAQVSHKYGDQAKFSVEVVVAV